VAAEENKSDDRLEEIKLLKEKTKKLEEAKAKEAKEAEESVAGGLLKGIGKSLGLGGLIKGLEKSSAFRERLKQIDDEIERKMTEQPLKRVSEKGGTVDNDFIVKPSAPGRRPAKKRRPPPKDREADVFDEADHVKIIAEIPGVKEQDIKIRLERDKLTISCHLPDRQYNKQLLLPCVPEGELTKSYKNGILEVIIKKV
jgi:HSP20 family protein